MENESKDNGIFQLNIYKTEFKKQDVSSLESFNQWNDMQNKNGKKIVRCPNCWSYEVSENIYMRICGNCGESYCQKCLKYLENDREHDHPLDCCDHGCKICCVKCCEDCVEGICDLKDSIFDYNKFLNCNEILFFSLIFIFGTPIMLAKKYWNFFFHHQVIDSLCANLVFFVLNFLTNIIYCFLFYFFFTGISFVIICPGIIIFPYLIFIVGNWYYVYGYEIDRCPIVELTVRTRSF